MGILALYPARIHFTLQSIDGLADGLLVKIACEKLALQDPCPNWHCALDCFLRQDDQKIERTWGEFQIRTIETRTPCRFDDPKSRLFASGLIVGSNFPSRCRELPERGTDGADAPLFGTPLGLCGSRCYELSPLEIERVQILLKNRVTAFADILLHTIARLR